MLGVSYYAVEYVDQCRAKIESLLASYRGVVYTANAQQATLRAIAVFEPNFFNHMVLALDGYFLHRLRNLEGKDGNPLNEVRILCESIRENDGRLVCEKVIKYDAGKSVLKIALGDEIRLDADGFGRLAAAFFAEIEARYPA